MEDKKQKFEIPSIVVIELTDKDLIITDSAVMPEYGDDDLSSGSL